MIKIMSLLKYWKLIVGGVGVLGLLFIGYHYSNTMSENDNLQKDIEELMSENNKKEEQYTRLEESISNYRQRAEEQESRNNSLRAQLQSIGDKDDEIQECLNMQLPDDFLDRLSE